MCTTLRPRIHTHNNPFWRWTLIRWRSLGQLTSLPPTSPLFLFFLFYCMNNFQWFILTLWLPKASMRQPLSLSLSLFTLLVLNPWKSSEFKSRFQHFKVKISIGSLGKRRETFVFSLYLELFFTCLTVEIEDQIENSGHVACMNASTGICMLHCLSLCKLQLDLWLDFVTSSAFDCEIEWQRGRKRQVCFSEVCAENSL